MTTSIFKFDGSLLTSVIDGTIDKSHATISLPGRGYQPYGEAVTENLVWMMENFSGSLSPDSVRSGAAPLTGQLWYDTSGAGVGTGGFVLKVYNGTKWAPAGTIITSDTTPVNSGNTLSTGSTWFDTARQQLNVWNGATWSIIGPQGAANNDDLVSPTAIPIPNHSAWNAVTMLDVSSVKHQVWQLSIGPVLFAIFSKDAAFLPLVPPNGFTGVSGDNKIYPGINFNSTVPGISFTGESNLFKSNQNNIPITDNTYNLGSPTYRFANFYSAQAQITQLGVNTSPGGNTFSVNGTSNLTGQVTIGAGSSSGPPLVMTAGGLSTALTSGAIEFDGTNYYFTSIVGGIPVRQTPTFSISSVSANKLYVSVAGNDANDGSNSNPFRTIKAALKAAGPGVTVYVGSGTYLESNPIYVPTGCSIVGDTASTVIVNPLYPTIHMFLLGSGTTIEGVTVTGMQSTPYLSAPSMPRVPAAAFAASSSNIAQATANMSSGGVASISYRWSASYDTLPTVYIEPPLSGVQAQAVPGAMVAGIQEVKLSDGGINYTAPTVTATGSTSSTDATLSATVLNGTIVAINVLDPGSDYTAGANVTITDSTGTGAIISNVVVMNNMIRDYIVTTTGSGYTFQPTVSVYIPSELETFTEAPRVIDCAVINGPYDTGGALITSTPPYSTASVDNFGSGSATFVDGMVMKSDSLVFGIKTIDTIVENQAGIGHMAVNAGNGTSIKSFGDHSSGNLDFCSIAAYARNAGTQNISGLKLNCGNVGLQSDTAGSSIVASAISFQNPGSGVTYNALPAFGGTPSTANEIVTNSGQIHFVTMDDAGNYSVGPYMTASPTQLTLSNLNAIGPLLRGGSPVGVQMTEVSDDSTLTHGGNVTLDHTTVPTQHAVVQYVASQIGGLGGVSTFNTRTGAVTLLSGDVTTALGYTPAPTNSPNFTGIATAPTPSPGTSNTQIATTAFVSSVVAGKFYVNIGDIVMSLGTSRSGALLLDGSTFSGVTYPLLAAFLGSTTLPDMRGYFPRGADNGRGIDPGRILGTAQSDALQLHNHGNGVGVTTGSARPFTYGDTDAGQPGLAGSTAHTDANTASRQGYTSSGTVPPGAGSGSASGTFANETRPKNIAFNFFIVHD